jgi:hypothetical protein
VSSVAKLVLTNETADARDAAGHVAHGA